MLHNAASKSAVVIGYNSPKHERWRYSVFTRSLSPIVRETCNALNRVCDGTKGYQNPGTAAVVRVSWQLTVIVTLNQAMVLNIMDRNLILEHIHLLHYVWFCISILVLIRI